MCAQMRQSFLKFAIFCIWSNCFRIQIDIEHIRTKLLPVSSNTFFSAGKNYNWNRNTWNVINSNFTQIIRCRLIFSPGVEFSRLFFPSKFFAYGRAHAMGEKRTDDAKKIGRVSAIWDFQKPAKKTFFMRSRLSQRRDAAPFPVGEKFVLACRENLVSSAKEEEEKVWKKNIPIEMLMGPLRAYYPFKGETP